MAAPVRFAVVGVDHLHAFAMLGLLRAAGGELAAWHAEPSPLADGFAGAAGDAPRVADPRAILEDASIALVASAAVPDRRGSLAAQVLRHGKDCLMDKPGAIRLEEVAALRAAAAETGRRFWVFFSERLASPATVRAQALVRGGAIGRPLHVIGTGPHRLGLAPRPPWFWDRARSGGILADLGAHQADQFLVFSGATEVEISAAHVGNAAHPERPDFEDFGEMLLRAPGVTGYARVDWFTPEGLETWGDVRLVVIGTEGTLEVRKNCDLAGRPQGEHLFWTDRQATRYEDCKALPAPFPAELLRDVREGSDLALPQPHVFRATELALRAQSAALRLGDGR